MDVRLRLDGRSVVIDQGRPYVAEALGVSPPCAHRWIARFQACGDAGLLEVPGASALCGVKNLGRAPTVASGVPAGAAKESAVPRSGSTTALLGR